ncbi:ABC transporter ATP-binding protein [Fibrobacter sp. UWB1]|uniref:ABC transporter ATP-binding protein n=1 Tax=unclassified Fibrobacter TaxID=2634177 RepID=UPI000912D8EE|nr:MULTISPECIES: ABC transporter ATP-binding protein [unclassified Fibrobacter]OWV26387.1 ABC transporter ATP-binding protein [Fibrobacter sp. UWB1]SHL26176.1 lipoprotein-releasing system ATP-binding protein [Fibrobacter sp. UWOV1]
MSDKLLQTINLRRVFSETGEKLEILKGVNFEMEAGELVALTGSSGSGKSTFLNLVGMLDTPTSGEILFKGKALSKFNDAERDRYHRVQVGFVFQFHHLLSEFTAIENVCVPGRVLGTSEKECKERAAMLLETVGLKDRFKHLPRELSGGERQRVAIARALMNHPDLVLADEPSGNLDEANSAMLNELIGELNEKFNQAFLIVTHDEKLASFAKRRVVMHGGVIQ